MLTKRLRWGSLHEDFGYPLSSLDIMLEIDLCITQLWIEQSRATTAEQHLLSTVFSPPF
jgi:hypothetical protein